MKHGMRSLEDAFLRLRSKPGQRFFPHPSEVAEEIERLLESEHHQRQMAAQTTRRQREIAEFWKWAPEWMEATGNDEVELLRRFPSFKETKLGSKNAPGGNVVQMPRESQIGRGR